MGNCLSVTLDYFKGDDGVDKRHTYGNRELLDDVEFENLLADDDAMEPIGNTSLGSTVHLNMTTEEIETMTAAKINAMVREQEIADKELVGFYAQREEDLRLEEEAFYETSRRAAQEAKLFVDKGSPMRHSLHHHQQQEKEDTTWSVRSASPLVTDNKPLTQNNHGVAVSDAMLKWLSNEKLDLMQDGAEGVDSDSHFSHDFQAAMDATCDIKMDGSIKDYEEEDDDFEAFLDSVQQKSLSRKVSMHDTSTIVNGNFHNKNSDGSDNMHEVEVESLSIGNSLSTSHR